MVPDKATTRWRSRGEAWREKAPGRTVALTPMLLGHAVTCFRCRLLKTNGSQSTSRHRPIAFSRKGLPLGLCSLSIMRAGGLFKIADDPFGGLPQIRHDRILRRRRV